MNYTADTRLGLNFRLGEFPCWQKATAGDVARLADTVRHVLQPVRDRWGRVVVTSWKWWRAGCAPRTGSHAEGGTVDFVTPDASLRDVFAWGVHHLLPLGHVGRWIYEPRTATQGEHIHVASRADMLAQFGDGQALAFIERPAGGYDPVSPEGPGQFWDGDGPTSIPGLTVTVAAPPPWMSWVLLGLIGGELAKRGRKG